ncbi:Single-stranded DNA-binding protein [Mycovorax composti]|uniref:Single-stranded DNA-binding protein n=2 Tax=Chitinophagaceae TaxID=563835 RepID=A0ABZ2EI09_9BACT
MQLCVAASQKQAEINKFFHPLTTVSTKLTTMYALKNKVQLIGNLGNAPEIKTTINGKKMARFSIATNETYKNLSGERVTETTWHHLVAWGRLADIAEKYLEKGREVAVEGKLVNRQYESKNGEKRYITEIQVHELLLLSGK